MKQESCTTETQETHQLRPGADFLQFAVAFAQLDLDALRQGDWLNLREDFEMYMGRTSLIGASGQCILAYPVQHDTAGSPLVWPLPAQFTPQDFKNLQQRISPVVEGEAKGHSVGTMHPVGESMHRHGLNRSTPGRRQLVISAPTADCFVKIFYWLIDQEPPDRILTCPECGRFFYRVKQQAYCSRKCGNRLTVRNYRARHAGAVTVQ